MIAFVILLALDPQVMYLLGWIRAGLSARGTFAGAHIQKTAGLVDP